MASTVHVSFPGEYVLLKIENSNPLHYDFKWEEPLNMDIDGRSYSFYSITQMFASCMFAQHGMAEESVSFWRSRQRLVEYPPDIKGAVLGRFQHFNMPVEASWLFRAKDIMMAVLLEVLENRDGQFRRELVRLEGRYVGLLRFVVLTFSGTERLWTSGHPPSTLPRNAAEYAGLNLYGECLTELYEKWTLQRSYDTSLPVDLLLTCMMPRTTYRRTVLVLGDSTPRHVASIESGTLFYESGLVLGDIAFCFKRRWGNVQDYKFVIVFGSTNDAQRLRSVEEREGSWGVMRDLLSILRNHPDTVVIFCTGIGLPNWPRVPEYTLWLRDVFMRDFGDASNFHFIDWSVPADYNFFFKKGRPDYYYLDDDEKHPTNIGTRRMWRYLCHYDAQHISQGLLRLIRVTFRDDTYSMPTISQLARVPI
jgi:hypothetical protein